MCCAGGSQARCRHEVSLTAALLYVFRARAFAERAFRPRIAWPPGLQIANTVIDEPEESKKSWGSVLNDQSCSYAFASSALSFPYFLYLARKGLRVGEGIGIRVTTFIFRTVQSTSPSGDNYELRATLHINC